MKKLILISVVAAFAAVMALTSCDSKKSEMVGEYEVTAGADGKVGLSKDGYRVLDPVYDKVEMDNNLGVVVATKGKTTALVSGLSPIFEDDITKVTPAPVKGYTFFHTQDGVYLLKNGSSSYWGRFEEIVMKENFLFFKNNGKWGLATVDHKGLASRKYDKIYIARNVGKYRVLVKHAKDGWTMYDKDGATDGAAFANTSAELEKQLKKYDTSEPVGILDVDWDMSKD